ncbi:MarR family transcriptional regulator [Sphingomonas morindae]|uniref:MarR family transcriptional regulator n=1 Tax=Sphingomonas morindae TaxID=1541170 RepID=A0ABY4X8B6_9SPHN|nr:MarR family transcriptional regulator [Sphingomonas morindae]USI73183.1 hypothetical protein LHA26_01495 [Sphingomonas morindae]
MEAHAIAETLLRARRGLARLLTVSLAADPALSILLDLLVAERQRRDVSVSSACIISGVPPTTAMRLIQRLVQTGAVARVPHPHDGRSTLLLLTPSARTQLVEWLERLDTALASAPAPPRLPAPAPIATNRVRA